MVRWTIQQGTGRWFFVTRFLNKDGSQRTGPPQSSAQVWAGWR